MYIPRGINVAPRKFCQKIDVPFPPLKYQTDIKKARKKKLNYEPLEKIPKTIARSGMFNSGLEYLKIISKSKLQISISVQIFLKNCFSQERAMKQRKKVLIIPLCDEVATKVY